MKSAARTGRISASGLINIRDPARTQAQTLALEGSLQRWPLHSGILPCNKSAPDRFPPEVASFPSPPLRGLPVPSLAPVIYVSLRAFPPSYPIWPSYLRLQRGCNLVCEALQMVSMAIMTILQLLWSRGVAD